jgi:signal peptidase II
MIDLDKYCEIIDDDGGIMQYSGKLCGILMGIVLVGDQLSKYALVHFLSHTGSEIWKVFKFVNLVLVYNNGLCFGLFNGSRWISQLLFPLLLLVIIWLGRILLRVLDKPTGIWLSLLLGGAVSNLVDRILRGTVVDFIDITIAGYHWPAFNLADSCILFGMTGLWLLDYFSNTPLVPLVSEKNIFNARQ